MGTVNKVILIGRLGRDPEERITSGGIRISNFSISTDNYRNGSREKAIQWHRVVAFGRAAELCNQYLRKGQMVCIEGSLQTRCRESASGVKSYFTDVVAAKVTFLTSMRNDPRAADDQGDHDTEAF